MGGLDSVMTVVLNKLTGLVFDDQWSGGGGGSTGPGSIHSFHSELVLSSLQVNDITISTRFCLTQQKHNMSSHLHVSKYLQHFVAFLRWFGIASKH